MRNKALWIVLGVIVVAIIVIVAVQQTRQPKEEKVIKIGAILPLTGPGAEVGNYSRETIALLLEHYQDRFKQKGYTITVDIEDSKSNPRDGVLAYQKLCTTTKPIAILTQMSSVANAVAPLAARDNIIVIGINSSLEPQKAHPYFFVNYLGADTQAALYHEFLTQHAINSAGLLYVDDEYGRSVKDALTSKSRVLRWQTVALPVLGGAELRSLLVQLIRARPQAVVLVGYGRPLAEAAVKLREMNFGGIIIFSPEALIPSVFNSIKGHSESVYVITFDDLPDETKKQYRARLNRSPTVGDAMMYSGFSTLLEAILQGLETHADKLTAKVLADKINDKSVFSRIPLLEEVSNRRFVYKAYITPITESPYGK